MNKIEFKELQEKKLIENKNGKYYAFSQGNLLNLGTTIEKAISRLQKLGSEKVALFEQVPANASNPTPDSSARGNQQPDGQGAAPDSDKTMEDYDRALEKVLGGIQDIQPDYVSSDMLRVSWYHPSYGYVDMRKRGHPALKGRTPHVRWMDEVRSVDNGDGHKNKDYTVLRKDDFRVEINGQKICLIKVERDESPKGAYWKIGKQLLCGCKRDQFEERQRRKVANKRLGDLKGEEGRKEFFRTQSKLGDPAKVARNLEFSAGEARESTKTFLLKNGATPDSAEKRLSDIAELEKQIQDSPEKAMALMKEFETTNVDGF